MPITLSPISRRRWIKGSLAAAFVPACLEAAEAGKAETWVLFSDTHIAADEKLEARGAVMGENLTRCVNQVLNMGQKPFGALLNGDVAYLDGQQADYATFLNHKNAVVTIRDNGIGISQEHIGRLFEPYFTSKNNGIGLGLAATLNIIQSHKARVEVESEMGKCTTFIITFPLGI